MAINDYLAIGSFIVACAAFAYTYISNTKKYELISEYRKEILEWYSGTIGILIKLKCETESASSNLELKNDLLCKLCTSIEIGRFYFPNVNTGNGFGNHKREAYKGYRNLMLDFLVYSCEIYNGTEPKKLISHAEYLQKHFTSYMFEVLDPKSFLKETKKHTDKTFSSELSYEEYISNSPDVLDGYI